MSGTSLDPVRRNRPTAADNRNITNDGDNSATVAFTGQGICAVYAHRTGHADQADTVRQRMHGYPAV